MKNLIYLLLFSLPTQFAWGAEQALVVAKPAVNTIDGQNTVPILKPTIPPIKPPIIQDPTLFKDVFEPDDTKEQATTIFVGDDTPYQHTLHTPQDEDWFRFYANAQIPYQIITSDIGSDIDIQMSLYNSKGELVVTRNEKLVDGSKSISFTSSVSDDYLIRVQDILSPPVANGVKRQYRLKVKTASVNVSGYYGVRVFDAISGLSISGAEVCHNNTDCEYTTSNGDYNGTIAMSNPNDSRNITLVAKKNWIS